MKNLFIITLFSLILMTSSAKAAVLNFDDGSFPNPVGGQLSYIYNGLTWYNLEEAYDDTAADWPSNHEAYTKPYSLKSVNDKQKMVSISSVDPTSLFTFNDIYLRTYSAKDMNITIKGYIGDIEQYSFDKLLNSKDYVQLFNTAYDSITINKLVIDWGKDQGGINIDVFGYTPPETPTPEPSSLILSSLAVIPAVFRRFFKAA